MSEPFFYKKALTQVVSCKTCEIFKNDLFYRTPPVADSDSFRFPGCNFVKKRDSSNYVFLSIVRNFKNTFFIKQL